MAIGSNAGPALTWHVEHDPASVAYNNTAPGTTGVVTIGAVMWTAA